MGASGTVEYGATTASDFFSPPRPEKRKKASGPAVVDYVSIQAENFLTKEQLRERLNLPSVRKIDDMMKRRMIPFLKWGSRTVRFDWPKVQAALQQFERKAAGQK